MEMAPNVTCLAEMVLKLYGKDSVFRVLNLLHLLASSNRTQPLIDYKALDCCRLRQVTSIVCLSVTNVSIKMSYSYVLLVFKTMDIYFSNCA